MTDPLTLLLLLLCAIISLRAVAKEIDDPCIWIQASVIFIGTFKLFYSDRGREREREREREERE